MDGYGAWPKGWVPVCRQESGDCGMQLQAHGSLEDTAAPGKLGLVPKIADSLSSPLLMLGTTLAAGQTAVSCAHPSMESDITARQHPHPWCDQCRLREGAGHCGHPEEAPAPVLGIRQGVEVGSLTPEEWEGVGYTTCPARGNSVCTGRECQQTGHTAGHGCHLRPQRRSFHRFLGLSSEH